MSSRYNEFRDDLLREAEVSGDPQHACFFQKFAELAAENGDCGDLTYTPVRKEGSQGYQVDGYALDLDRGELHLAVCDLRTSEELESLNQSHIDTLFRRVERFFKAALQEDFTAQLEETSPAFEAAWPISASAMHIKRVRLIIFSNGRLATRKKEIESKEDAGRTFTYNLLDFGRYTDIQDSRSGSEPIEIDISELSGDALPCLQAHTGGSNYASYLVVIPGELLAKIYGLYGPRLLEQNVRTFLQARTKVNRGIIQTIEHNPEMFFAFNNGLTATASGIETSDLPGGGKGISSIHNLQIVNGGQTTASILYAKDRNKSDLEHVYVQMKLSVVDPEQIEEIVPKISRYANTQNRISEADFFSSHPFHVAMEKISRRLPAPQKAGSLLTTKWFYERARGQYRDQQAYGTASSRRKFEAEFPKDQVILKTDLAKYELTFQCRPDAVSRGAQKCFLDFAEQIGTAWEQNENVFNEGYFRDMVAMATVFRWTDRMVSKADWYVEDRGYKANIVTYAIAWLVDYLKNQKQYLDLQLIWNQQEPDESLQEALQRCAPAVAGVIKDPPPNVKNISEYCKRAECWQNVRDQVSVSLPESLSSATVGLSEIRQKKKDEVAVKKIDNEVEFDKRLVELFPHAGDFQSFARRKGLLSPKSSAGLTKLAKGSFNLTRPEKNALKYLFGRMEEAGYEFPS